MLMWSLVGSLTGALVIGTLWVALGFRRRRLRSYDPDQAALVRAHNRRLRTGLAILGGVLLVVVDSAALAVYRHEDRRTVTGSPVFVGTEDVLRDPEVDVEDFIDRAIETTCDERPDFVLVHDHLLGHRIAAAGCATYAVLDGRSYAFVGPQPASTPEGLSATEFTSGSAGGHVDTQPDPGVIKHPATFTILTHDPGTGTTSYAVVSVDSDASVTVSPEVLLPHPDPT